MQGSALCHSTDVDLILRLCVTQGHDLVDPRIQSDDEELAGIDFDTADTEGVGPLMFILMFRHQVPSAADDGN